MSAQPLQFLAAFRTILNEAPARLVQIREEDASRSLEPGKWSAKQELGHLVDSAVNNHIRLIRMQVETHPDLPGYAQNDWVRLNSYQERSWEQIVALWRMLNTHLVTAAEQVTAEGWQRTGVFISTWGTAPNADSSGVITLQFLIEDYVEHMRHHLDHIARWLSA